MLNEQDFQQLLDPNRPDWLANHGYLFTHNGLAYLARTDRERSNRVSGYVWPSEVPEGAVLYKKMHTSEFNYLSELRKLKQLLGVSDAD